MGSEVAMIFSSSGASCSIFVAMLTPCAGGGAACCISSSTLAGCFGRRLLSYQLWRSRSTMAFPTALPEPPLYRAGRALARIRGRPEHPAAAQAAGSRARGQPPAPRQSEHRESYIGWIRRFILFHGKRHPAEMGAPEVVQ